MRRDACAKAADGVCADGLADELAVAKAVEHGGMGAEETAPAHPDGREHGDGVVVDDAFGDETRHQADGGTHGAEGRHGERNQGTVLETEEPFEDEIDLVGRPADDGHAFVGHAHIFAIRARGTKGEHHHDGGDAQHARDDGEADAHAVFAAVQKRVEETHEHASLALEGDLLLVAAKLLIDGRIQLGIGFQGGALHQSGGDNAPDDCAGHAHQCALAEAQARHESHHHQAHAESRAEVGERNELVFLEIAVEVLVVRKGDDGGIVAQKGHDGTQGRHARQVVERLHQRTQQIFEQANHAKLGQELADGAHQDADGHDVEHGFEQQVVGRLHESVQHLGQGHLVSQQPEEGEEDDEEHDGLKAAFRGELQWRFALKSLEETFHYMVVGEGASFLGVVFGFCHGSLFFGEVKQIDFPGEAEVGLEHADAVHAGVRAAEVQAQAAVAHGVVFEAKALEIHLFLRRAGGVVGSRVGQAGGVVVVACFGKHDPFRPDVHADAIKRGEVLAEKLLLSERSAMDEVEIHLHAVELQLVAQRDIVDELAGLVFHHVHGIGRLERAEVAVPHQVVGIDALHGLVDEGRVAHLQKQVVLARLVLEVERGTHLVAAHGVPEFGAVVDVDGVGVVFPAADGNDLFSSGKEEVVGEVPVQIGPVGALEKGVGEADVGRVDALAQVVAELAAKRAVQGHHQVFARKAVVAARGHRVVTQIIVVGEVGAGVQLEVVQGDKRLLVLREGLQETEKA